MGILLVGMNHKTAPLEVREGFNRMWTDNTRTSEHLKAIPGAAEAFFLSTCNRVEILITTERADEAAAWIKEQAIGADSLNPRDGERHLYTYRDREAVRHLFRVASSLDSLVMGETQILGQVKDAYRQAVEWNSTGTILNRILHHAFRVAKRIRTETGIAENAVSVSYAAVELAKKIFGDLSGKTVLLIGAGEMSELAARHLMGCGVARLLVTNRTYDRAVALAETFCASPCRYDQIESLLSEADIVISSTGASSYIITADMVKNALRRRKNRLLFLIDIAVPRDIDPATGNIDNVYAYNIDNLQDIVDENVENRKREAQKAEAVIDEELDDYAAWINSLEVIPTIVSLRTKMEEIMKRELEKSDPWLRNLDPEERKKVEILSASIVNKILHDPMTELKEASADHAHPYAEAIRRLFRLQEDNPLKND